MIDLENKIEEIKFNLISKNLKYIIKCKHKTIPTKDKKKYNELQLKSYTYYVKLIKKLKIYLKNSNDVKFFSQYDAFSQLVCIVIDININKIEINIPIDIRVIIGDKKDTYMKCAYYQSKCGILYLEEFVSSSRRYGYGSMLLDNLDYIVNNINISLNNYNKYSEEYKFKPIEVLTGRAIPFKSVISQYDLNKLYTKYGFKIDNNNYLFKNRE